MDTLYKEYEYEGDSYILVKDVASVWYPNCIARNQTTQVRKKLNAASIPVKQIRITTMTDTGRQRMAPYWAFYEKDLQKVEQLSPGSGTPAQKVEEEEIKYGCVFYIIQKYPVDAPAIVKMGRTTKTAEARSRAFYVWNPKVLREFPISPCDEKTLIRMIANGSKQVGEEEFIVEDIEAMLKRADIASALLACSDEEDED